MSKLFSTSLQVAIAPGSKASHTAVNLEARLQAFLIHESDSKNYLYQNRSKESRVRSRSGCGILKLERRKHSSLWYTVQCLKNVARYFVCERYATGAAQKTIE